MIKLRPGQKEVAEFREGYMAVPAVPGAGKTTVLAYLSADLIEGGFTKPGKILIVTVMNSAVSNFRSRIGNFLEDKGLPRTRGYDVKTLHSLAMSILKEKPQYLLINDEFQIVSESQQWDLISSLTYQWMQDNEERWKKPIKIEEDNGRWYRNAIEKWTDSHLLRLMKEIIGSIKSWGLAREDVRELRSEIKEDSYLLWGMEIFEEYSKLMHRNGWLDFDDLIVQAVKLLKQDQQLCQRLRKKWTYIFEDEAQDSNPLQEEILHLLAGEDGNLVRVGDSNQAIMGTFTAAEPRIFREFAAREDVNKESILYSSRSTVDIINLANFLVRWSRSKHPQPECRDALEEQLVQPVGEKDPVPNPTTEGYTIAVKRYETSKDEIKEVAKLAINHARTNEENTIAIIVPNRFVQQDAAEFLEEQEVDFEEVGRMSAKQAKTIYDLQTAIKYLAEPHKKDTLIKLLKKYFLNEFDEEELESIERLFNRYSIEELIYPIGGEMPWLNFPDELFDPDLFAKFTEAIEMLRYWLDASVELPPDELVLFLTEQMRLKEEPLAIAQNIALQIKSELNVNPSWKLLDVANELPRLEPAFRRFAKVIYEQKGYEPRPGVISLITAHKAKGLEWDTVYLTSLTSAEFPSTVADKFRSEYWYLEEERCNPTAIAKAELKHLIGKGSEDIDPLKEAKIDEISERLRLLYVAITRARKNLLLTCHKKVIYGNGFEKKVNITSPLLALHKFITEERKRNASKRSK